MPAKPNPERDQRIRDLVAKGLDDKVIAARCGMSYHTLYAARRRLGLSANKASAWTERA